MKEDSLKKYAQLMTEQRVIKGRNKERYFGDEIPKKEPPIDCGSTKIKLLEGVDISIIRDEILNSWPTEQTPTPR